MNRTPLYISLAALCVGLTDCTPKQKTKIQTMPYPQTAKVDVVDNYHGTLVADPYRWLEDDNSAETAEWVAAENAVTNDYISQIPFRDKIDERLTQLWNYERISAPHEAGGRYFYFYNDGLSNQSVLYMKDSIDDTDPVMFLDPNTLSEDGTAALGSVTFSRDGRYMAYGVAHAGSDWVDLHVKEIPSGRDLDDCIRWLKFSGAHWDATSEGFYYAAYDEPVKGSELSGKNEYQKVYYHKIGTSQAEDQLVFQDPNNPLRYHTGFDDGETGKYLFISTSEGTSGNRLSVKLKGESMPFRAIMNGFDNNSAVVKVKDDVAYILTNENAPNYKIVAIDLKGGMAFPRTVIPEADMMLQDASIIGDFIFAKYMKDATSKVFQFSIEGDLVREVELPGLGTVAGFENSDDDMGDTFYTFSTFTAPPSVYRYNVRSGESALYTQPEVSFDPSEFTVEQIFFESKDGTRVPMFVCYRRGLKMNGQNPTFLYGYGGFNAPMLPGFSPANIAIMEAGGIYVMVNLRGGNEYGEKWHRSGMLESKQNVFDDFIAAAEYLIANKYTSSAKLCINGGSNGGLLVGACMTQRPDLYAVAIPQVGVLDMLRYHLFTVGWGWAVEYGSSDDPEQFEYIYKYSPLHNIHAGTCYPATLITTGDHDDRVVPAHSFKFAATLQEAQGCDNPVLIRIDANAGHGAGKPVAKRIDELADVLSFFFWNTDTDYKVR